MTARVTYTNGNVLNASDLTNAFAHLPYNMEAGTTASAISGSVTFTTTFNVAPVVFATVISSTGAMSSVTVSSVSTTGFNWYGWSGGSAASSGRVIHWIAVQMTSTTANG
jgi:hypothetical protein